MDQMFIDSLEVMCPIGAYPEEHGILQRLMVSAAFDADLSRAAETDDLSAACDYSGIPARISRMLNESHTELIERAALLIAALLVREYGAPWARVSVYKPDALDGVKGIGVTIERTAGEIRELERRGVL